MSGEERGDAGAGGELLVAGLEERVDGFAADVGELGVQPFTGQTQGEVSVGFHECTGGRRGR